VSSVLGPMANSLNSLITFMKSVISGRPWTKDPYAIRKAWDEDAFRLSEHGGPGAPLCIGIMWHNAYVHPHPPITRALRIVKEALLAAGHTVIDWTPHKARELQETLVGACVLVEYGI
jgi:amidase